MNRKPSKFDTLYISSDTVGTVENMVSSGEEIRVEKLEVEGLEISADDGSLVVRSSE